MQYNILSVPTVKALERAHTNYELHATHLPAMNRILRSWRQSRHTWAHWFVIACILLAFTRLVFDLDAKPMWWDESLSLQRAEQAWGDLLRGRLVLWDGDNERVTWDQHPFAYYVLLGLLLRVTDDGVFILRFVSLLCATLLVPAIWGFARFLEAKSLVPRYTGYWATGLAALNPFVLWYGQEARPYALWMLVSLTSFWFLWAWMDSWTMARQKFRQATRWGILYLLCMALALTTHFYAIMMIPLHGMFIFIYLHRLDRKLAVEMMTFLLLLTGTLAFLVYRYIMSQPGAGSNYVAMGVLDILQEIFHAFGTGLSTRVEQVGWLDLLFQGLAVYGIWHAIRSPTHRRRQGWFLGTYLLVPVVVLFAASLLQPNYMAARHHGQLVGVYIILVAAGLAALTGYHQRAAVVCGALVLGGTLYSSYRYYEAPVFSKAPDYAHVSEDYLEDALREDDLVIFKGPNSWRLFRYYFPLEELEAARAAGVQVDWKAMPHIRRQEDWFVTVSDRLTELTQDYARVWLVEDRTLPYEDPRHEVLTWFRDNMYTAREWGFYHPNASLSLFLFLPEDPNPLPDVPALPGVHIEATFGQMLRLAHIEVGKRLWSTSDVPLTLYWEVLDVPDQTYRYITWLVEERADGTRHKMPHTEQSGSFPVQADARDQVFLDFSHVEAPLQLQADSQYFLHVMVYATATGDKMPVTDAAGYAVKADEPALLIPVDLQEAF